MYNITLDRYYDRTNEASHADYKSVLFRAGDSLQSAEINEIQGTLKSAMANLSNKFIANGEIVSGLELDTSYELNGGGVLYDVTVTATEGVILADEEFVTVQAGSLTVVDQDITSSEFTVGVQVLIEEITHEEDATLLDPALETRNQGQPGAGRLKMSATLILESDFVQETNNNFYPLYKITDGEILVKSVDAISGFEAYRDDVIDIVAKYDRNANGNYLLHGHESRFIGVTNPYTSAVGNNLGSFWFSVADGSSNVDGYNYDVDSSRFVELDSLVDFELHQNEPTTFIGDGWYEVRHTPLRKVFRTSGAKTETGLAVTHGAFAGATDELPAQYQPVLSLLQVSQGATVFIQGTDYSLVGDSIFWLNGGNEPAPSSTYNVDFTYQYVETDADFSSDGTATMGDISPDLTKLYLHGYTIGTEVQFDYDFVLQRVDNLFIDSLGELGSIKGVPAERSPRVPDNDEDKTLRIAEVLLSGDADPVITLSSNRTFQMSDIQKILNAVNDNQYNIGRLALETDMIKKQPGASFRGQFIDRFMDDNFREESLDNTALTVAGNLIMEINWNSQDSAPIASLENDQFTFEMASTANPTHILAQPHYSKTRKVNSYLFAEPPMAKIKITPSVYRWIDQTNYVTHTRAVQGETRISDINRRTWNWRNISIEINRIGSVTTNRETTGVTRDSVSTIVPLRNPVNIPQIPLKIKSNLGAFNSGETVSIMMDGLEATTAVADSFGTLDGTFNVPANTLSGTKLVEVVGADSSVEGSTLFKAEPLSRTITTTVTTWWRWHTRRNWVARRRRDPLAQTFILDNDTVLDKIEVQFAVASQTDVTCIVCEATAGMPDKTKTVVSAEVAVADLAPLGSRQPFVFNSKVVLTAEKEYAFIIVNSDPVAELQVAKLGDKSLDAPYIWLSDPAYMAGVLFSSANNSAWTPHQEEDMRFWLYECTFDATDEFVYEDVTVADATDFMLMANAKVYEGTSIDYKVELIDRVATPSVPNEYMVTPYVQVPLTESYDGVVRVTAMMTSNGAKTPVLDADIQISVGTSERTSVYTSSAIEIDYHDEEAVAFIDCFEPTNTSIGLQIQIVDPVTKIVSWENMTRTVTTLLADGWNEIKFVYDLQNGGPVIDVNQTVTRVKINMATGDDINRPVVGNLRFNTVKV